MKLADRELRVLYRCSAGVLREVLRRRVGAGLAVHEPQQGYWVMPMTVKDLTELAEARIAIATLALGRSLQKGDLHWESRLVTAHPPLDSLELVESQGTVSPESIVAHTTFDRALLDECGNSRLLGVAESLRDCAEIYRCRAVHFGGRVRPRSARGVPTHLRDGTGQGRRGRPPRAEGAHPQVRAGRPGPPGASGGRHRLRAGVQACRRRTLRHRCTWSRWAVPQVNAKVLAELAEPVVERRAMDPQRASPGPRRSPSRGKPRGSAPGHSPGQRDAAPRGRCPWPRPWLEMDEQPVDAQVVPAGQGRRQPEQGPNPQGLLGAFGSLPGTPDPTDGSLASVSTGSHDRLRASTTGSSVP